MSLNRQDISTLKRTRHNKHPQLRHLDDQCHQTKLPAYNTQAAKLEERNEMDGACGTYGEKEICMPRALVGKSSKRDHLEDLSVSENKIGKLILKKKNRGGGRE